MYALVDCNNFFASCERVFNPKLEGKPVAVLSNNDGCIVARSNEVKALGIPMGAPYFKWKTRLTKHKVHIFSSNYGLYGDMSARVMQTCRALLPNVRVYSIDEAFAEVRSIKNLKKEITDIRHTITTWTGIPVSIGVGPTKTLAKAANEIAKKKYSDCGVRIFHTAEQAKPYMKDFPVRDIWGIGRGYGNKLFRMNIHTAAELMSKPESFIKKEFGTLGVSTIAELKGQDCTSMDSRRDTRKSVIKSRSFGKRVTSKKVIKDAVGYFADSAATKLRQEKLLATCIRPYFFTSRFEKTGSYSASKTITFEQPTNNSTVFIEACRNMVEETFKQGFRYAKAGIACYGIVSETNYQPSLFHQENPKEKQAMKAYDKIRNKYGKNSIRLGGTGLDRSWWMRQKEMSTIDLRDVNKLPMVKA